MSLPAARKAPQDEDKPGLFELESDSSSDIDPSSDPKVEETKPQFSSITQHLNVNHGANILRISSPDAFSEISVEDVGYGRTGRPASLLPEGRRHASRSPAPQKGLRGSIQAFWIRNKGLAYVLLAQVFGTLMNVTTRILELEGNNGKGMHPFQILFARMGITVILASAYMWWQKIPNFPFGAREVRPLLVARGLGGFFGVFGMYYSLMYLPLADATVITFLAPSIACWACSYLINEPFTRLEQIAAMISLFGVVLIARPTSLFSSGTSPTPSASGDGDVVPSVINGTVSTSTDRFSYDHVTPQQRAGAVGMALLGVLGAACAFTTIRWIGKRAHPLLSVNYFATWCSIVSTVMMFALPGVGFLLPANLKEWTYLFLLGICGFIMQFLLASGLQYEKSSRATNMVYTQMFFALGFDKLVFGTTPGLLSIIGSSLILGSAIYVAVQKEQAKSKNASDSSAAVRPDDEEGGGLVAGMDAEDGDAVPMSELEGPIPDQEIQLRTLRT